MLMCWDLWFIDSKSGILCVSVFPDQVSLLGVCKSPGAKMGGSGVWSSLRLLFFGASLIST